MLASASRARHSLLEQVGIDHYVMASGVNEEDFECSDALKLVDSLALAKAKAVASKLFLEPEEFFSHKKIQSVLGCDSVFVFQNEIFGKPRDFNEVIERWIRMSSNSGVLITGHALLFNPSSLEENKKLFFNGLIHEVVKTKVEFESLTRKEIENYVYTGEPLQCAGGFALEGKGVNMINAIEGCFSNVIGLSLPWLRRAFIKAGI